MLSATTTDVAISELQLASSANSSHEFIELVNSSEADASLAGWQLQYRAATSTNGADCAKGWTTKATIPAGAIPAQGHYLFAATGYLDPDATFTGGLSNTAGTIRLVDAAGQVVDALAWGAASCGLGSSAAAPAAGSSLERRAGAAGTQGDNAADFMLQAQPTPQASLLPPTPSPSPTPTPPPIPSPAPSEPAPPLELTELLVDPAPPLSDAEDEFVEIHNRGTEPVQVEGYIIKTGSHQHSLPSTLLEPDEYLVITSGDTAISLTNSGGVANLLDPAGAIIDTAGTWGSAEAGASWALVEDAWRWTLTPTPGIANVYTPVPGAPGDGEGGDYPAVQLTELLPDPASPLTDTADEYIEIHNPTDEPADLTGYTLKVGHDLTAKYVIKDVIVPAGSYVALKSATTKLALANDGSSVALYAPDGVQLGATVTYGKAQAGDAWARFENGWSWTAEATPSAGNILMAIATPASKAAAVKAAKTVKAKAVKTAKPKATPKPKVKKTTTKPLIASATTKGGHWLLFTLAALTIGYIIYEFRYDIRNYYFKLRGHPINRPTPLPAAVGRGSDRAGE